MEASIRVLPASIARRIMVHFCRTPSRRRLHSSILGTAADVVDRHNNGMPRLKFRRPSTSRSRVEEGGHIAVRNRSHSAGSESALYTPPEKGETVPFVLKPELNFDGIFQHRTQFEESVKARKISGIDIPKMALLWQEICKLEERKSEVERERKSLNARSKALSKQSVGSSTEKDEIQQKGRRLRDALKSVNSSLTEQMNSLYPLALALPNRLHSEVPVGEENRVLETVGDDLQRFSRGATPYSGLPTDGSDSLVHPGYAYTLGNQVLRGLELQSRFSSSLSAAGFTRFSLPDMFKPVALEALGIDSKDSKETYAIETSENAMHLSGTSPLGFLAYYMMTVLEAADLPQRCFAVGRRYNPEAESPTFQGIYRQFQDSRVELFGLCEGSDAASGALFSHNVEMLRSVYAEFPVPFRIVEVSSTRLLPCMDRKQSIEVWLPSVEDYVEVANVCSCTDFISRRLKIRYPSNPRETASQSRKRSFVHTIHGTALRSSVLLAAILEREALGSQCVQT